MKILYHLTSPEPAIPESDAVFQEVNLLKKHFDAESINLFPLKKPSRIFPKMLYGRSCLAELLKKDKETDIHHVFFPTLYPFPVLKKLKKPVIYSVTAGLQNQSKPDLASIKHIVVSNKRDQETLNQWGLKNHSLIHPGIDTSKFRYSPLSLNKEFVLLAGSAPWISKQFSQKGIDSLLESARLMPDLKLVFLWRGLLFDQMKQKVKEYGVESQVEIINEKTDVNQVLTKVHASVVLAENSKIVKAWPHSLIESLVAGKPVLLNQSIPMSDYVNENKCGQIISDLYPESIAKGMKGLREDYTSLQENALSTAPNDFSQNKMIGAFKGLYKTITS